MSVPNNAGYAEKLVSTLWTSVPLSPTQRGKVSIYLSIFKVHPANEKFVKCTLNALVRLTYSRYVQLYINVKYVKIISRVHFKNKKINRNFPFLGGREGSR